MRTSTLQSTEHQRINASTPHPFAMVTSREKLIANIIIAGAYEIDSPVVIIALAHYFIFAGDT
jgi:hypothetical protein